MSLTADAHSGSRPSVCRFSRKSRLAMAGTCAAARPMTVVARKMLESILAACCLL